MNSIVNQNQDFNQFFKSVYESRWEGLSEALLQEVQYVHRKNLFFSEGCDLKETYKMDPASLKVAEALQVQEGDFVLDLCAAPGGKSLILAEKLNQTGQLISNEFSASRRERLVRVFKEYIPLEKRNNIFVQGKDGQMFGLKMPEHFDRVLADVPCSGERHLLENSTEFKKWTKKRSQNLAVRQFSLLSSAWLCLKPGGVIVYSTCSISPFENDQVVEKLIKRRGVEILRPQIFEGDSSLELTDVGYQILPDRTGYGPMYFSVIKKT